MRKKVLLTLLLSMMMFSVAQAGVFDKLFGRKAKSDKFRVGYANMADTDVFVKARKDAFIAASKDDASMKIMFTDANLDMQKQLDQIDNFIMQQVDAIVVVPVDYEGIVPGVEKANEAGIPVIALGIESAAGESTFVGSTNVDAGRMQGEFMAEKLPKNAKVLYLEGTPGLYHSKERWLGFKEALLDKRSDVKLLSKLTGEYDREKGMKVTEDWIQKYPKFDAIIAANDQMALGAVQALRTANRLKGVLVSGVDGVPEALDAIEAGEMAQSIFQNAVGQGSETYNALKKVQAGEKSPEDILVPFESITKANVGQYK